MAWLAGLRELLADASPRRRLMLALLVALPLLALVAVLLWPTPPAYRVLFAKLSDRAGGEVIAALEQLDVPYRLAPADGRIEVPADRLHLTRYRLAALGLPRSDADARDEAERAPRFGVSSQQEQQRAQRALELDLARSIQTLEAVELARVHLALPRVSPFLRDAPPATAAVLLRLRPAVRLSAGQVTTIQTLVAASVPRLKRSDVQVLDPRGALLAGAAPEPAPSPRMLIERDLTRRALAVLTPWLGASRVSVQVTATLDEREIRQTVEQVRSASPARPGGKTVRITRLPEGRIERIQAIVILGFEADAAVRQRAGQLARQALGLQPARGDSLGVYVLPVRPADVPAAAAASASGPPARPIPQRPSPVVPLAAPAQPAVPPEWIAAAAAAALLLGALAWLRSRRAPGLAAPEVAPDTLDQELDQARSQVLADPRVTADVIRLWMRA